MVQIKAWIFYLDIYAENSYKWDRRINMYGAIASSSSIAAWAIWKEWSYVWAVIIAISQVLALALFIVSITQDTSNVFDSVQAMIFLEYKSIILVK